MYTFYYRNYLKGCNYRCTYCPFPKNKTTEKMIARDKDCLEQFVHFLENSNRKYSIFFAPRGEALLYKHYQQAIIRLSRLQQIQEIVMQTNLSCKLEWLTKVDAGKLILWTTYHPGEVKLEPFLHQVGQLISCHVRCTVGMVGVKEHFAVIQEMKELLKQFGSEKPYLWVNAYKDKKNYYDAEEVKFLKACDPLFEINLQDYTSKGMVCKTGEDTFFIECNGDIHRCWQDKAILGNLYSDELEELQVKSPCRKNRCGCFIGYSHSRDLSLERVYKNSLLGRIP